MARQSQRLSAVEVERIAKQPVAKVKAWHDGEGLYLIADGRGREKDEQPTSSWVYRYMFEGKARMYGLGPWPAIKLGDARKLAAEARRLKALRQDPLAVRDKERAERRAGHERAVTFRAVAMEYMRSNRVQWKNDKHAAQWKATLETYVYPVIGDRIVGEIDTNAVLKVLRQDVKEKDKTVRPLWEARPETASRLRGRVETVLDYAKVKKLRDGDNPAAWRGNLKLALPARAKVRVMKHHAALPVSDAGAFTVSLQALEGTSAKALEFAILTAARTGEVLGATWGEIDLDQSVWAIPGTRMKAGREHRVPLSDAAKDILVALKPSVVEPKALVFPGSKPGKPLSNMALLMLLRRMKREDLTAHGFRSTFRDWVSEQTSFSTDLAERALAHAISDKTEAAYARGDLFEKRRALMEAWAGHCKTVSPARKPPAAADQPRAPELAEAG